MIKKESKNSKIKLSEMIGGRSQQVRNVPTDFPKGLRTQIRRYISAICIAGGGESAVIWHNFHDLPLQI